MNVFKSKLCGFDSNRLLECHTGNSSLFVDKYISAVFPDLQLELLLDGCGISNYDAWWDPGRHFKHIICETSNVVSELFIPNIRGDRYNPYIRYMSSIVCGSQQVRKLLNLAGLYNVDLYDGKPIHKNVFNLLTLTFPQEISLLLVDPLTRSDVISRLWKCYKKFFKQLYPLFGVDPDHVIGSSASLHVWSSEFAFLPHAHFHIVLPHFSYLNMGDTLERCNGSTHYIHNSTRDDIDSMLSSTYSEIRDSIDIVDCGTKSVVKSRSFGSRGFKSKSIKDVPILGRFIPDPAHYENLRLGLSRELGRYLDFEALSWKGLNDKAPLNVKDIRSLWSKIVKKEFKEIKISSDLDIYTEFCNATNRAKLLHFLQYKARSPVLDFDLFLKKCPNFITNHNSFNSKVAIAFIRNLLKSVNGISSFHKRYKSILSKAKKFFKSASDADIIDWFRFLCTWCTDTRVFGFWHTIKRYQLDPVNEDLLVVSSICSICGGSSHKIGYVDNPVIDSLIFRLGSKFAVFNVNDLPDPGGTL